MKVRHRLARRLDRVASPTIDNARFLRRYMSGWLAMPFKRYARLDTPCLGG